ncbi:hypothetical protein H310_06175 [Aphanomyces invadans]|uniref:Uncharacterized protein n=1 Tax=Aphanomyces invadans TaxID=157072 RepID=A0A024U534_9STRA|nr:hypothetical protein H310_06175 [Aphanomyces invadans]ETW01511.1 hypothetical protein H310_06175 [Aphanomyces invadans]|eukprot:XP_008869359.1 hypothetical protein H310_06175 [Aphanomyces invadans]
MHVDLSRRGIAYIPEDVDERATALVLSSNRIYSLHDLGRLVHLRRVDLSSNKIVSLSGIEVLGALVWLNVSRNSITSLDGLQHLAHLESLDVSDNNLTDIDTLEHNMSLTHVNASINCINVWPRFAALVKLEELNLNDNQLPAFRLLHTVLPPQVRQLHLARNCIDHVQCFDTCRLQPLTSLHTLELAGNDCVINFAIAMAALSSIFPSLTTLDGQAVKPPPVPVVSRVVGLDLSDRDVKMQMWKQVLQQRSQQEQIERLRLKGERQAAVDNLRSSHQTRPPSVEMRPPAAPQPRYFATHTIATNSTLADSQEFLTSTPRCISGEAPLSHSSTFVPHNDVPAPAAFTKPSKHDTSRHDVHKMVAALQDHVQHMRRYMKVWVKREQWLRTKSATCIQKYYRGHLARVKCSRLSVAPPLPRLPSTRPALLTTSKLHTSSNLIVWPTIPLDVRVFHVYAQVIQKIVRGWCTRQRLERWQRMQHGALQVQRLWRGHVARSKPFWIRGAGTLSMVASTLVYELHRLSLRVGKLERQVVIQDEATVALWSQVHHMQAAMDRANLRQLTRAVIRLQAAWRGRAVRKQQHELCKRKKKGRHGQLALPRALDPCQQCQANAAAIAAMKQQLDQLSTLVRQLTLAGPVSPEVKPSRGGDDTSTDVRPTGAAANLQPTGPEIESLPPTSVDAGRESRWMALAD